MNNNANDTTEIIQIINLYGLALDSHAWDLMPEIFTEDAIADFGPAGALWVGVDKLAYAFKIFHETLSNHMHTMYGHVVKVEGDKANAFTYGDWLLERDSAEGGPSWLGRGWYDDELVRTEKGWRISKRVCRLVSWSGNPSVPQPSFEQHPVMDTFTARKFREEGKLEILKAISAK